MIWLGVLIAFSAAVANAFALVLQGAEAAGTPDHEAARLSLLWRLAHRPLWLLGTLLLTIGWPLQILALSFAPLTVVQPVMASFQLVLLLIVRFHLKQQVGRSEWLGAVAFTCGVVIVILAAPHRTVEHPPALRVAIPLVIVGAATLAGYVSGRLGKKGLVLALGAGCGYAWADFADKLVSNSLSSDHLLATVLWLAGVAVFGVLAFLLENSALQRQSARQVAPIIGVLQEPLPIVMALAAGIEVWEGGAARLAALGLGIGIAGIGAAVISRSAVNATTVASPGAQRESGSGNQGPRQPPK